MTRTTASAQRIPSGASTPARRSTRGERATHATIAARRRAAIAVPILLACPTGVARPAHAPSPATHHHGFGDAARWSHVFDDPGRDEWQKPHEVIQALALAPDAVVADIGAGTGYFAMRLATMIPRGRVYAVDVEPDMVRHLAERARREHRSNVVAVAGTPHDPRLPRKVDVALLVDVYHHVGDRPAYFRALHGALAPAGRVAIIDFRMDAPIGPPREARVAPERAVDEMRGAGYALSQRHEFLPHQYFLVFSAGR